MCFGLTESGKRRCVGEGGKGGGGSREIEHNYKNIPRCACLRKTQQGNISVTPAAEEIKKKFKS